ncbi:MAG: M3 family oligoendopeptidase [Candidatus Riflebacteria bacterium]|nr:M3 family oligoendopeptidase [Candidatus Riflebacteria bacterium]
MVKGIVWDLTSYFNAFNSPEMKSFKSEMNGLISKMQSATGSMGTLDAKNQAEWEQLFIDYEQLTKKISHYGSYVGCLHAADANNEDYARESAEADSISAEFSKIDTNLKMGLKKASDQDFSSFCKREKLADITFHLTELRTDAQKTMSSELENLATDLSVDGFSSWDRLYNAIVGKLGFDMHWPDGRIEKIPMAQCRSLMQDSDRKVRQAAFEHGNHAWEKVEDVCAAALNAISGTRLLLNKHRGFDHFLDVSLLQSRISRKTLDAMFQAIAECRPLIQKLGKAKAKALGQEKLAWYDCEAPLAIPSLNRYSWEECVGMNEKAFSRAYPELCTFFKSALEKKWVESEPRPGKRPGAFCTGSLLTEESRVFMSYAGSLSDVSTLAHEIGHAFHSSQLNGLRPFKQGYPMTLAESASTFAEILLAEGILTDPEASDAQKLNVLTGSINHGIAFLIDIPIRFNFEKAFHEERMRGEVSVSRFKALMTEAMQNQFGELLEENGANPFFWASKMHFYITGVSFYNYPYTFGYLLSRGLFEMFKREGSDFLPKYQNFLRLSGSDMAQSVAQKALGADLENTDFWKRAIMGHEPELVQFEELSKKVLG